MICYLITEQRSCTIQYRKRGKDFYYVSWVEGYYKSIEYANSMYHKKTRSCMFFLDRYPYYMSTEPTQ
jgi:hypothetical protein